MGKLKVEYIPIAGIKPYKRNAKLHPTEQIEQIKRSIQEFGFNDPIGIWKGEIVEGHGRYLAAKELGLETVPVIRLDGMTDEQRRAYALVHNKLTINSDFDLELLDLELGDIELDMEPFGFKLDGEEEEPPEDEADDGQNIYTSKTDIPQYEPSGENVELADCLDKEKYETLIKHIQQSSVSDEEKFFLCMAAARHLCFSYKKIADYYASKATKEMQELMEESALVLIDYGDAIKNGYAVLRKTVTGLLENEK